jgi:protein SCO1/2
MRTLRLALAGLLTCVAATSMAGAQQAAPDEAVRLMNELMSGKTPVGGPFTLTDTQGHPRSLADFRGTLVLLYFGYTSCPDVCPTDLAEIARLLEILGKKGAAIQPIFITLDPERDTDRVLREYAATFHPRLLALRGSQSETRAVARAFKIGYRRVPQPGSPGYVIDHSAFTFLLDRQGRYVAFFPPGTPAGRMATMLRTMLPEAP